MIKLKIEFSPYTERILHYWLLLSARLSRVAEREISPTRLSSVVARIHPFFGSNYSCQLHEFCYSQE